MSDVTPQKYMLSNHNLGLDLMRATEAAALAAARWAGRGQKESGDGAAVGAMREVLSHVRIDGTIVIGEGEKDEAPMLANGEKVGTGDGPAMDIAVDPVDGTRLLAWGMRNSIALLAGAEGGSMYNPKECFYMRKLAVGADAADVIDLEAPIGDTIRKVAKAKGKPVDQITVGVLNRDRHQQLIADVREAGAATRLFTDGDVAAAVMAAHPDMPRLDLMAGIGGSPEGVVTACAMKALGGRILARLAPTSDEERQRTLDAGHDLDRILDTDDLVTSDNTLFVATGITPGDLVEGVSFLPDGGARTHSIVMRSASGTIRYVDAYHHLDKVEEYQRRHEVAGIDWK
ncbi:class II fructose-bisphosphatase [Raineyella sp. LH-20]|nr:class II fructose-bisphosphatase [Raineyella sp. LH-20]WOP18193.1 class II fructose-bisphosphatase [Raineyella sp. LH-20]